MKKVNSAVSYPVAVVIPKTTKRIIIFSFLFACISLSCKKSHTPKPKGYLRIEIPAAQYLAFDTDKLPCGFNISTQTTVEMPSKDSSLNWLNIDYYSLKAKIYCSYRPITPQSLHVCDDECRRLIERTVKNADAINERFYENRERHIYATLFLIEGESASPIQFMLTDSVSGFFRGALYYTYGSNADSLAPVTEYIKKDIIELIQSFYWKE
ncbi:MAG: gliding motility protein GldD [Tannerella sp.]|jgi:gliding motility-associated lipoprotein GldD|nr:gliding motility protein GldD [Tannerella sp.]